MSLKTKLLITLLLIGLLPAFMIGFLSIKSAQDTLNDSGNKHVTGLSGLEAIADLKVEKIDLYFHDRVNDIVSIQDYFNVKTNLPIVSRYASDRTHPDYLAAKKMLDDQLRTFQKAYDYEDVMLVNPEGKIVYSSEAGHVGIDLGNPLPDPDNIAFYEGKTGVYISNVFESSNHEADFEILITAPIVDFDGKFAGVVALEINMFSIYEFLHDSIGLGDTGETLIAKKMNDHVGELSIGHSAKRSGEHALILNPLRYDADSTLKKAIYIGDEYAYPIQQAVQKGKDGSGLSLDYAGNEILAVWRHIPSLDWGLVAKISADEVLSPVETMKFNLSIIIALSSLFILVISILFSSAITRPIKKLKKVADDISTGGQGGALCSI